MADEWPTVAAEYQIIEQIGQGAFAKVWKAYCVPKKIHVAIKIMDLEKITTSFEDIRAEVQTMKMTNHPNVLKCYCSFVHKDQLWLVTQLMNKGSCLHVMNLLKKKGLGEGLKEEFVAVILHETLKGLQYFHENGQIHRDIKAGNILLDIMEQVRGYDYKADIWSLGITALELAKGYAPYARFQPMKVLLLTLQEDPPSLRTYDDDGSGHQFGRHFKDVVKLCLQKDPSKRPGTSALLKHSFFKKAGDTVYLAQNLLTKIEDIGESCMTAGIADALPGAGPLYAKGTKGPPGSEAEGSKYVPGTTWVFDDEEDDGNKMSIDDFASQFDKVTGGEEFRSK
ncbi:hypothetical protein PF003_g20717 [Phytophthora fragariae]|nr:hypothetical protein PF003_g20717 [Phytophthora fragariae]